MSQKLHVNGFKWIKQKKLSKFNEDFIKNYNENSTKKKKVEKVGKLICSIENK